MTKVEIDIPNSEYDILAKVAQKLGLSVQAIAQQEIDHALAGASVWMQRADMLQ